MAATKEVARTGLSVVSLVLRISFDDWNSGDEWSGDLDRSRAASIVKISSEDNC